jgi:GntR family transcriptional regulator of vanillate catabolism
VASRNLSQFEKALLGLRSLVLGGAFTDMQRLSEVAVAEQLGISRTPLRQAMDRLIAEGLLERIETGGCRVARFTRADIADAIEIRGVIEGTAARMAAERGPDPVLFVEAKSVLDRIDHALTLPAQDGFDHYLRGNEEFHSLLARLSGSQIVQREIERLGLLPFASPSAFISGQAADSDFHESLRYAQRQHRALLDAIEHREGARAEALAREHARLALANLNSISEDRTGLPPNMPGLALVATD